ncbi:MAG: hypothetical protein ABSG91_03945 [Syntrophobacteraceae bacterium]
MEKFDIGVFRAKWPALSFFSRKEIRGFLRICSDIFAPAHKEALDLLLYPDGVELSSYYIDLASYLQTFRIRTQDIPRALLQILCELLASAGRIPRGHDAHELLVRLLSKIPPILLVWLFEKRFPLRQFIGHIEATRIFPGIGQPYDLLRKRWRLLRKRLIPGLSAAGSLPDPGLEITLADLGFLAKAGRRPGKVKSEWRIHGTAIVSKVGMVPERAPAQSMRSLYWGGARSRKLAFWEKLIWTQAGELTEIRRLASEVGNQTGRVVLSWHNASLGAAGGWAFEDPAAQFASPAAYCLFVQAVLEEASEIRKSFDISSSLSLFDMRAERLFAPQMARAVEHSRVFVCENKSEWPGALSPHQRITPEQVFAWMENARKTWAEGLILLFALANQGQRMIDSGKISSLVLPWVDKFFISSRRRADSAYLERLFRLVSASIKQPLILFWDDTSHSKAPSLGLAMEDMAGHGLPFRGIGIFDTSVPVDGLHGAERARVTQSIVHDYPEKALFALRPLNENHCPDAYRRILKDLDMGFFLNYDSSWKDNLAFIYTGTQVFPLLPVQTEMELVSPWVSNRRERVAFGTWFRRMLRRISLGKPDGISGRLWLEYCSWANLL